MRTTDDPRQGRTAGAAPVLAVDHLDVHYGRAHVLQSVSLTLDAGVLAVVGRNGMGKTTLCRAITGMAPASGSVRFQGHELVGLTPDKITRLGVGYVPQGRRVWRSLTVDETLQLASRTARRGEWTVDRVYHAFPRLAERRRNGGAQLSGGEQQMLAIGRALLFNPRLLVMDEPTEGLAPVIVEHVATMLKALADEGSISILLIEQNLGVALEVAETVAVMVNGRIARTVAATELASDTALQQRLLGLQAGAADMAEPARQEGGSPLPAADGPQILRVQRAYGSSPLVMPSAAVPPVASALGRAGTASAAPGSDAGRAVYLVALAPGRAGELAFMARRLAAEGLRCVTLDAPARPFDAAAAQALRTRLGASDDLAGLVVAAGLGQGALAARAVEGLPTTLPKFIVAADDGIALASAQAFVVRTASGPLNRVVEAVLAQVVSGLAALVARAPAAARKSRPAVCITTLGFLSPLTRALERALSPTHDCVPVQMDDAGQRSLAGLIDSGLVDGLIDLLPADVPVAAALGLGRRADRRFDRLARAGLPYVGTAWGLDLLHFADDSRLPTELNARPAARGGDGTVWVPASAEEADRVGAWYGERLNACAGPVRLLLPRPGTEAQRRLSLYHDALPAQAAARRALTRVFKTGSTRRLSESAFALDDPRYAEALAQAFLEASASHIPIARPRHASASDTVAA